MALHAFQRVAYRLFGRAAKRGAEENPRLRLMLQRAHIPVRPDVYLASGYLAMLTIGLMALVPVLVLVGMQVTGLLALPIGLDWLLIPLPLLVALSVYLTLLVMPDLRAASRARSIDAKLPYALNHIATMSSAGATPQKIFGTLGRNPLYGEVQTEAAWIHRDMELLGLDIVTALNQAVDRTPSIKFQDLLQGAITALTSGGDLKQYFLNKSEQFMHENRQEQTKFLEGLGVLAESFVTVVVAAPLFLIVLLSVMTSFGSSPAEVMTLGYLVVLVLLPLSQIGFAATIRFTTPEV